MYWVYYSLNRYANTDLPSEIQTPTTEDVSLALSHCMGSPHFFFPLRHQCHYMRTLCLSVCVTHLWHSSRLLLSMVSSNSEELQWKPAYSLAWLLLKSKEFYHSWIRTTSITSNTNHQWVTQDWSSSLSSWTKASQPQWRVNRYVNANSARQGQIPTPKYTSSDLVLGAQVQS